MTDHLSRRAMIAGAAAAVPVLAHAADKALLGAPATVISNPPRVFGPDAPPNVFPDPDVISYDPAFGTIRQGHGTIKRLGTGYQWAEGPAWSNQGQYVVFSDVMGDTQYRYIWETGEITPFRKPSLNSNGNSFDYQGRQICAQDFSRRVVRWEHDGSMTILADNFQGKPFNSPNDFAVHKDGSVWFSDPLFGGQLSEGHPDQGEGPFNRGGYLNPHIGNPASGIIGSLHQILPPAIYRIDPSGRIDQVIAGKMPNGLAFSPDCSKLYFLWGGDMMVGDVQGTKLGNVRVFTSFMVDGVRCGGDGHRVDVQGNVWSGSNSVLGYMGVTVWNPAGKCIGRIRLPETCANLCFAGPKRDWLFMTASQSVYMIRTNTQGAAPS
ncbi:MAG TPA: SMP-30/gluconolactonase/LRE family protein [Rhizomicrobium sp.]|nr:SMP-30/gluconolactonase/LRE family protein [Rhizomicrobium sp.]